MTDDTTDLLRLLGAGDDSAADALMPHVYRELHGLAENMMRGERGDHTLQPTALVNEAFVRLANQTRVGDQHRLAFLPLAARAMRNILVDHARARGADRRGGGRPRITFEEGLTPVVVDPDHMLDVDSALTKFAELDPQAARVVELRFFGGMTHKEIAGELGVTERTIERYWRLARAWLMRELAGD